PCRLGQRGRAAGARPALARAGPSAPRCLPRRSARLGEEQCGDRKTDAARREAARPRAMALNARRSFGGWPVKSRAIVFPEAGRVAVVDEEVGPPGPGEVLCRARQSLVSLGTEGNCLRGVCDPGTYWEEYIRYPFRPGYSMAAEVVAAGAGVTSHGPGD